MGKGLGRCGEGLFHTKLTCKNCRILDEFNVKFINFLNLSKITCSIQKIFTFKAIQNGTKQ